MKIRMAVTVVLGFFIFTCCGGGKYGDIKKAMNESIAAQESFITAIEKAKNGKEVASAIDVFSADMVKIKARMEELAKKYPEVTSDTERPAEIRDVYEKQLTTAERMVKATTAVMFQYANDPDVRKAASRLGEAMR